MDRHSQSYHADFTPPRLARNSFPDRTLSLLEEISHANHVLVACDHHERDVGHGVCRDANVDEKVVAPKSGATSSWASEPSRRHHQLFDAAWASLADFPSPAREGAGRGVDSIEKSGGSLYDKRTYRQSASFSTIRIAGMLVITGNTRERIPFQIQA
jgi:hypothetical protein